jgi:hypothetical protein
MNIGAIAYFKNEVLQFYWRDPAPDHVENPIRAQIGVADWSYYYRPTLDLILSNPEYSQRMLREPTLMPVSGADIDISIHPVVLNLLIEGNWERARHAFRNLRATQSTIPYQLDGIAVVAGRSWVQPLNETENVSTP